MASAEVQALYIGKNATAHFQCLLFRCAIGPFDARYAPDDCAIHTQ